MTDTPQRREAKRFEPPPWEQPQFEELARRREEEQAEAEIDAAVAELASREREVSPNVPDVAEDVAEPDEAAKAVIAPERQPGPPVEKGELDEAAVAAMLEQLKIEEPAEDRSLWKIGVGFSGIAAVIGSVLVVWGLAALMRARAGGAASIIGGATLIVFGGLFVGVGMWTAVRNLKQRGVL